MGISSSRKRRLQEKIDLEDACRYQFFVREAQELESWIVEKTYSVSKNAVSIQESAVFNIEFVARSNDIVALQCIGKRMIANNHPGSKAVEMQLNDLIYLWVNLLSLVPERGSKLHGALMLVKYITYCKDIMTIIYDHSENPLLKDVDFAEIAESRVIEELTEAVAAAS